MQDVATLSGDDKSRGMGRALGLIKFSSLDQVKALNIWTDNWDNIPHIYWMILDVYPTFIPDHFWDTMWDKHPSNSSRAILELLHLLYAMSHHVPQKLGHRLVGEDLQGASSKTSFELENHGRYPKISMLGCISASYRAYCQGLCWQTC